MDLSRGLGDVYKRQILLNPLSKKDKGFFYCKFVL
jgi:hypothetical protein